MPLAFGSFEVWLGVALDVAIAFVASGHVVLHKRDTRSAAGWAGLIWLAPFLGAFLYALLGINRMSRYAGALKESTEKVRSTIALPVSTEDALPEPLQQHAQVVDRVSDHPRLGGNLVEPLYDGDEAYPAMIAAIEDATISITLVSYIFEASGVGAAFVDAIAAAKDRGVEVRILIDDVGTRYGRPRIHDALKQRGVRIARFLPALLPRSFAHINLRNHCKVMVVDGHLAFTGGMNIRPDCVLKNDPPYPTHDTHFRVEGPVVAQLQAAFARDWLFAADETLEGAPWFPELEPRGEVVARAITDGPDEGLDRLPWTFQSALEAARKSIRIVTPYFLPDTALLRTLQLAALRGVVVDVVVPERGNLPVVRWAMWAHYRRVLHEGVRVWLQPSPFDHSKLFVVDRQWSCIGSANWDPRSLRLNFELNVECYDDALAEALDDRIQSLRRGARELTLDELERRPLWQRLRDGTARLGMPYL